MALLTFDTGSTGSISAASPTLSYTCSGSERLLIVLAIWSSINTLSGIQYNGVALVNAGGSNYGQLYYLKNPALGANNLTVTATYGNNINLIICSYNGFDQTTTPVCTFSNGTTTPQSVDGVVTIGGSRVIGAFLNYFSTVGTSVYTPDSIINSLGSSLKGVITDSGDLAPQTRTLTNSSTSGGTITAINAIALIIAPSTPTIYSSGNFFAFF